MKNCAIVCESKSGNTRLLAETLKNQLPEEVTILSPEDAATSSTADILFVGCWTEKGDCPALTAAFLESLRNRNVFLFGTCGFGSGETYFDTVYHRFAAHLDGSNHLIGHFICQGKMPEFVLRRFEAMKAANPGSIRWEDSIENFHGAQQHPNHQDLATFANVALQAMEQLSL